MNTEDKEIIEEETTPVADANPNSESADNSNQKSESTDDLQSQLDDLNDKYLRAVADMQNTRRRAALDLESAVRATRISVVQQILPIADAIDAAIKHDPENAGFVAVHDAILSVFANLGITRIDSVGAKLDPNMHNAIASIESDSESNTIIEEMQPGYKLGDTIIRHAMVTVAK